MNSPVDKSRRRDIRRACRRDLERFQARERGHRTFWRSLGVLGAVGWPIILLAVGGAILGHWLDQRWQTGVRMTLMLIFIGVMMGSVAAWHQIQGTRR